MPIQFKSSQILHALIAADYDFAVFIINLNNLSGHGSQTAHVKIKYTPNTFIKLSQAGKSFQVAENGNPPNFSLKTFDVLNNNASFNTCPAGFSYQWI